MIDLSNYNVYQNKDGRLRAYNKTTHKVTSYPRVLMEMILGRPLLPTEDVHHKDENPMNNDPDNLEVIDHREHERQHGLKNNFAPKRKYTDKEMICPICKKLFIWTSKQQSHYFSKTRATEKTRKYERQSPCCSKSCAGKYAAAVQYSLNNIEGNLKPKERICPICGNSFIWKQNSQWRFKHNLNEIPEPCCSLKCIHALRKQIKAQKTIIA